MLAQLFHKDPEGPLARPVNGVAELWQPSHSVH
jgi:hypothetical protein